MYRVPRWLVLHCERERQSRSGMMTKQEVNFKGQSSTIQVQSTTSILKGILTLSLGKFKGQAGAARASKRSS